MKDERKTKKQLIKELVELRQRIAALEATEVEHRQVEEALKERESRYQDLYDHAPDMFVSVDAATAAIIECNQTLLTALGYTREEIIGRPVFDVYAPESVQYAKEKVFPEFAKTGEVEGEELQLQRKDGSKIDVLLKVSAVRDDQGNILYSRSSWRNITERKRAEKMLRDSEEKYRTLFDTMAQGVVYQTADEKISSANPAAERILGLTLDQMQGRTSMDPRWRAIHEDGSDFPGDTHPSMVALKTGKKVHDVVMGVFSPPDNKYHWITISAVPLFRPGETEPYQVYATFVDITERRAAEKALRESEARFRTLIDAAPSVILGLSPDGRILNFNPEAERLYGRTQEEVLGQNYFDLFVPKELWEPILQDIQKVLAGEPTRGYENRIKTVDGSERVLIWNAEQMPDSQGRSTGIIAVGQDITERKQAEEILQQHAANLEASNNELDAFAHTVAHDIKGSIGQMVGFAEALVEAQETLSQEETLHYLSLISQAGRKTSNIVDELLLLASVRRVENVTIEPLDMMAIVTEAQNRLAPLIKGQQAEITLPTQWPLAVGYSPWVEEIWVNYLDNSVKYGGEPPQVELGATPQSDGTIRFWVRDNGAGLTLEEQDQLFRAFERLDQVRVKGHGLGLSIVQRIVLKLGGQVGVESVPGEGSTFWFTLPAADETIC